MIFKPYILLLNNSIVFFILHNVNVNILCGKRSLVPEIYNSIFEILKSTFQTNTLKKDGLSPPRQRC